MQNIATPLNRPNRRPDLPVIMLGPTHVRYCSPKDLDPISGLDLKTATPSYRMVPAVRLTGQLSEGVITTNIEESRPRPREKSAANMQRALTAPFARVRHLSPWSPGTITGSPVDGYAPAFVGISRALFATSVCSVYKEALGKALQPRPPARLVITLSSAAMSALSP